MAIVTGDLGKVSLTVEGAYDSTVAYEKLSVVSANGISYISKKAVPAGTALSNTTYWMPLTDDTAAAGAAAAAAIIAQNAVTYIASVFDTSTAYAVGEYVIYDGSLYKFTTAHSAGSWNSSQVSAVSVGDAIADLQSHEKFRVTGNASEGTSVTFTDARINSEHWRVPKNGIFFGTPSNVTSEISWTTNITNHTITLQATFAGATTVDIDLEWYQ